MKTKVQCNECGKEFELSGDLYENDYIVCEPCGNENGPTDDELIDLFGDQSIK